MRRFTRLTNGFWKEAQNLPRALTLHFMYLQVLPQASNDQTTPAIVIAIATGITDQIWTLHDIARLPDFMSGGLTG